MRRVLLLVFFLGLIILQGCASTRPFPNDWSPPSPVKNSTVPAPEGRFANGGTCNQQDITAPTLSALLFEDKLEGFEIDSILIRTLTESSEQIRIKPYVGEIALKEERLIRAVGEADKEDRWTVKTSKDYLDGYTATASVLWTGGAVLPIAAWDRYNLKIAEDGSLLIHMKERVLVDFFYFFPVTLTDETWLRYPPFQALETVETASPGDDKPTP